MSSKITRMDSDIGKMDMRAVNPFLVSAEEVVLRKYRCRLFGEFVTEEDFLWVLEVLETAQEGDEVHIHLSSPGGNLDAVMALIGAMNECKAHTHIVGSGTIASAATFPLLCADSFQLMPHTSIMFHTASFGAPSDKAYDTVDYVIHQADRIEKILNDYYIGFFDEEEIKSLLNGKTYWMLPDEFCQRYEVRSELFKELQDAMQEVNG